MRPSPCFVTHRGPSSSQSKAVVRRAYAEFTAAEQDLILRTVALYLNLLAARDLKALADAELKAVGGQLELVEAKRRGGLSNVTDEYEAQARYFSLEADVIEADAGIQDAREALREVIGEAIFEAPALREEIPLVTPEPAVISSWVDRAVEQNLSLAAAKEAVSVAQQEVKRRRGEHYPTLDLVANYGNQDQGGSVTHDRGLSNTDTAEIRLQFAFPDISTVRRCRFGDAGSQYELPPRARGAKISVRRRPPPNHGSL